MAEIDPLEAVKMGVDVMSRKGNNRQARIDEPKFTPPVEVEQAREQEKINPPVSSPDALAVKAVAVPVAIEQAIAQEPVIRRKRRFRVMETRVFMWGGYVTTLSHGSIVDEDGYGIDGIQRMIDQGFKLAPLE